MVVRRRGFGFENVGGRDVVLVSAQFDSETTVGDKGVAVVLLHRLLTSPGRWLSTCTLGSPIPDQALMRTVE